MKKLLVIECYRNPANEEIKFGYGATHFRDFTTTEIGLNKHGKLKKWFVAENDGLRYFIPQH